jgi:hypothetical protein
MDFVFYFENIFIVENQILLNFRKDNQITNTIQSDQSFSNSRLEQKTRFYHLVISFNFFAKK